MPFRVVPVGAARRVVDDDGVLEVVGAHGQGVHRFQPPGIGRFAANGKYVDALVAQWVRQRRGGVRMVTASLVDPANRAASIQGSLPDLVGWWNPEEADAEALRVGLEMADLALLVSEGGGGSSGSSGRAGQHEAKRRRLTIKRAPAAAEEEDSEDEEPPPRPARKVCAVLP